MKILLLPAILFSIVVLNGCENGRQPVSDQKEPVSPSETPGADTKADPKVPAAKTDPQELERIRALVRFDGRIEEYIQWTDSLGEHIVLTSEKDNYWTSSAYGENDLQNVELSCHSYLKESGSDHYSRVWKIQDYSKACEVDAVARFKKNVLQHTDLNDNGVAEVWVMYYTACKGDVSPSVLKLIMYEGTEKFKMTGETLVDIGSETVGGKIGSEGAFKEHPVFLAFAKALWKDNCAEN